MLRVFGIFFFQIAKELGVQEGVNNMEENMLITFSNITERLSLYIHCRMIPQIIPKMMLFPLVFQILALALTLTHPSHVGLDEGE